MVSVSPLLPPTLLPALPGVRGDSSSSMLDGVRGRSGKCWMMGGGVWGWGGVRDEDSLPLSSSSSSELEESLELLTVGGVGCEGGRDN